MCMHGGTAILTTANSKISTLTGPLLLETDVHSVVGCPFQIPAPSGTKPSPCIRIEWSGGSSQIQVNGVGLLLQTSTGKCYSPEGAMQGIAVIAGAQGGLSGI
jgi:hypothetical protein